MSRELEIVERLKELRRQEPFSPFVITTSDGKRREVTERLSFAFTTEANQTVVVIRPLGGIDSFRRSNIVSIDLLTPAH